MEHKTALEDLYPHLFMNDAKLIVNSMLKVDNEASLIKSRATGQKDFSKMTIEEKQAVAFQCLENAKKQSREKYKMDQAKSAQKKILREYDPRIGMEERHMKVKQKRQDRISKESAEEKLDQLRAERQKLIEEIAPEDLEKIREEVKKNAEETRKQDLLRRKQIKDMMEKEKIAKQREELKLEKERKEKVLMEYRLSKMVKTISEIIHDLFMQNLYWAYKRINIYSITLRSKALKISRKHRFKRILKAFHRWQTVVVKLKLDEEAAIYQAEQEKMEFLTGLAAKNYEFWLKRKYFEAVLNYVNSIKQERLQQAEALKRREKLENFINFVRVRTEEEEMKKQAELVIAEKRQKEYEEFCREQEKKERAAYVKKEKTECEIVRCESSSSIVKAKDKKEKKNAEKYDREVEANFEEISLANSEKYDSCSKNERSVNEASVSCTENLENSSLRSQDQRKKTPKPPKELLKMQQRQEERKLKREALEAKYKEKREKEEQAKKEQAIKQLEEEKKAKKEILQKKKAEEKLKKDQEERKKQELYEVQRKTEIAENFYNKNIQKRYFDRITVFYYNSQKALIKAEVLGDRTIKKIFFRLFIEGAQNCRSENLRIEEQRLNSARNYYSSQLKRRFFYNFFSLQTSLHERLNNSRFFYSKTLLKKYFGGWVESIPLFLDEKYEQEKQEDLKISDFQRSFWVPKLFSAWVLSTTESKEQKLKDQFTQSMWEKAQLWLSEGSL